MATIVNNPGTASEDSGAGVVIGVVIALLIIVLFFAFALPYIRTGSTPGVPNTGSTNDTVNIQLPDVNTGAGSNTGGSNGSNSY